jgi:hypothetical protein
VTSVCTNIPADIDTAGTGLSSCSTCTPQTVS